MDQHFHRAVERMTRTDAHILACYAVSGSTVRQVMAETGNSREDVDETIDAFAGGSRDRAHALVLAWQEKNPTVMMGTPDTDELVDEQPENDTEFRGDDTEDESDSAATGKTIDPDPDPAGAPADVFVLTRPNEWALAAAEAGTAGDEVQGDVIEDVVDLLDAAENSGNPKLVRAAEKIRDQIRQLQADVAAYSREARLRAELADIEARAARIREELRTKRPTPAPAAPTRPHATAAPSNKEIRAWAAAAGLECPGRGRIPGDVMAAYQRAHALAA